MKIKRKKSFSYFIPAALVMPLALLFSGCSNSEQPEAGAAAVAEPTVDLAGVFVREAPEGPVELIQARSSLQPGDAVTVRGRIGGARDVFVDGFAVFVLTDNQVRFCNETGDDACDTPWDACCEDDTLLSAGRALVQIPADGTDQPVRESLRDRFKLEPLKTVVVKGTVAGVSTPEAFIINADEIFVRP